MFSGVVDFIKNRLQSYITNVYTYKPIPKDTNDLNALGRLRDDFELAFINRTGVDVSFRGLGVEDAGFERLKAEVTETYIITIFRSYKDETRFKSFQNKVDEVVEDFAFADYTSVDFLTLKDVSATITEFYLLGDIVCHRADVKLSFVKQI